MANRMPHTAGAALIPGRPAGTARTAAVRQVTPRSKVRAIDVQGACEQGEVPSTNASRADTNVKDIAANPYGTRAPGTGECRELGRAAPGPLVASDGELRPEVSPLRCGWPDAHPAMPINPAIIIATSGGAFTGTIFLLPLTTIDAQCT